MPIYKLTRSYEAYSDGVRYGPWQAGDTVVLDERSAEWVNRDSSGVLELLAKSDDPPIHPEPGAGARPRVNGDPDNAEAAAAAQERVHADAVARQAAPVDAVDEDEEEPTRQQRTGRDRQHRSGRNRSG